VCVAEKGPSCVPGWLVVRPTDTHSAAAAYGSQHACLSVCLSVCLCVCVCVCVCVWVGTRCKAVPWPRWSCWRHCGMKPSKHRHVTWGPLQLHTEAHMGLGRLPPIHAHTHTHAHRHTQTDTHSLSDTYGEYVCWACSMMVVRAARVVRRCWHARCASTSWTRHGGYSPNPWPTRPRRCRERERERMCVVVCKMHTVTHIPTRTSSQQSLSMSRIALCGCPC
jgi:hypothetical protein